MATRLVLAFLMILGLGISLGLPAQDVLDAVCDESETLPYESTPLVSDGIVRAAAPAMKATLFAQAPQTVPAKMMDRTFTDGTTANRYAGEPV
ncbi:MAG: hypothetical protein ACRD3Q_09720, partial [Terriglobales bacterium]